MFGKIGATIVCFGVMCADSANLLIPVVIVLFGAALVAVGEWRKEK